MYADAAGELLHSARVTLADDVLQPTAYTCNVWCASSFHASQTISSNTLGALEDLAR